MNDDHLVSVARQPNGINILFDMARDGEIDPAEAAIAILRSRRSNTITNRLSLYFIRVLTKVAGI